MNQYIKNREQMNQSDCQQETTKISFYQSLEKKSIKYQ